MRQAEETELRLTCQAVQTCRDFVRTDMKIVISSGCGKNEWQGKPGEE